MRMFSLLPGHDWKRPVEEVFSTAQFVRAAVSRATRRAYGDGVLAGPDLLTCGDALRLIWQLRLENAAPLWFGIARYPVALNGVLQLTRTGVGLSP
jgi:hypothetical protein